jgi:CRISPR-associated protein Cst2
MSKHLFGLIATPYGIAANNRGETDGNITTLQKLLWNGDVHTTVSAEAIRWAIRYCWQSKGLPVNRRWREESGAHEWADASFLAWTDPSGAGQGHDRCIDDDALGYMRADAAKDDGSDSPGSATKRRGVLEVTRAISMSPFAGDITFNAAGVGATASASKTGRDPVPYGTEVHATRYQYGFALTPERLDQAANSLAVLDAVVALSEVAGNQSRFLFDFAPEAVIFRWTDDFAPRMLYGFEMADKDGLGLSMILGRLEMGDLSPEELIVGVGRPDLLIDGARKALERHGVRICGVRQAAAEMRSRMAADLGIEV